MNHKSRRAIVLAAVALLAAACGGGSDRAVGPTQNPRTMSSAPSASPPPSSVPTVSGG